MIVLEWFGYITLWSIVTIAPWFFMLARLKNMGYSSDWHDIRRVFQDFGYIAGSSVLFFALIGVVADVWFNAVVGSIIFRELPNEGLFTQRVTLWSERADSYLDEAAETSGLPRVADDWSELDYRELQGMIWKHRLNRIMPGHV